MVELKQNLQELIGQYDEGIIPIIRISVLINTLLTSGNTQGPHSAAQKNKHVRIEGTNYYFDAKTNQQGRYMSISEVKGTSRSSILVPESSWDSFYDGLDDSIKKVGTLHCLTKWGTRKTS